MAESVVREVAEATVTTVLAAATAADGAAVTTVPRTAATATAETKEVTRGSRPVGSPERFILCLSGREAAGEVNVTHLPRFGVTNVWGHWPCRGNRE